MSGVIGKLKTTEGVSAVSVGTFPLAAFPLNVEVWTATGVGVMICTPKGGVRVCGIEKGGGGGGLNTPPLRTGPVAIGRT